jgi:hemolysin activation/secretion protein
MMKKIYPNILLLLLCLLFPLIAPATPLDQHEHIQREQQRLLEIERRKQELEQIMKRPAGEDLKQEQTTLVPEGGACININELALEGNTVFSAAEIDVVFAPYRGQCLTLAQIGALLQDITNLYIEKGYITSRAFMVMPQNRLQEGILEVSIVEGKINSFKGIGPGSIFTAFPWMKGKALNLRDIEQGVEQINRLPSNRAVLDIKPTEDRNGYSDIIINNEPGDRFRFALFNDNAGSKLTGEWRTGVRLNVDNPVRINDQVNLSYAKAPSGNYDHRDSNSFSAGINVPLGYWTFNYNFSYSDYMTSFILPASTERYHSYGSSTVNMPSLDRIILRGQRYKVSLSTGLTHRVSNNYSRVADVTAKNAPSSRTLTVLNIDLPITFYPPAGILYIKPGFVHGVRMLGALDDRTSPYNQKAQYRAGKVYGYYAFNYGATTFSTSMEGQYSRDELYSSEAFSIGGEYSVRGFRHDSVQGDKGFSMRNDLSFNLNRLFGNNSAFLGMFTPGVFIDYGYSLSNGSDSEHVHLSGTGAKMHFEYKYLVASATYAVVLSRKEEMRDNDAWYLYAGINMNF